MEHLEKIKDILIHIAIEDGEIIEDRFNSRGTFLDVRIKDNDMHNIVTDADENSQKFLIENITEKVLGIGIKKEQIGFICEENGVSNIGEYTFVIDPIDGTTAFYAGFPAFAISIALFLNNELVLGLIYNPMTKQMYYAIKNKGAYCYTKKGENIKINSKDLPLNKMIFMGSLSKVFNIELIQIEMYKELHKHCLGFAGTLSFVDSVIKLLDDTNFVGITILGGGMLWDISACELIVTELGGSVCDYEGKKNILDLKNPDKKYPSIVYTKSTIDDILNIIK